MSNSSEILSNNPKNSSSTSLSKIVKYTFGTIGAFTLFYFCYKIFYKNKRNLKNIKKAKKNSKRNKLSTSSSNSSLNSKNDDSKNYFHKTPDNHLKSQCEITKKQYKNKIIYEGKIQKNFQNSNISNNKLNSFSPSQKIQSDSSLEGNSKNNKFAILSTKNNNNSSGKIGYNILLTKNTVKSKSKRNRMNTLNTEITFNPMKPNNFNAENLTFQTNNTCQTKTSKDNNNFGIKNEMSEVADDYNKLRKLSKISITERKCFNDSDKSFGSGKESLNKIKININKKLNNNCAIKNKSLVNQLISNKKSFKIQNTNNFNINISTKKLKSFKKWQSVKEINKDLRQKKTISNNYPSKINRFQEDLFEEDLNYIQIYDKFFIKNDSLTQNTGFKGYYNLTAHSSLPKPERIMSQKNSINIKPLNLEHLYIDKNNNNNNSNKEINISNDDKTKTNSNNINSNDTLTNFHLNCVKVTSRFCNKSNKNDTGELSKENNNNKNNFQDSFGSIKNINTNYTNNDPPLSKNSPQSILKTVCPQNNNTLQKNNNLSKLDFLNKSWRDLEVNYKKSSNQKNNISISIDKNFKFNNSGEENNDEAAVENLSSNYLEGISDEFADNNNNKKKLLLLEINNPSCKKTEKQSVDLNDSLMKYNFISTQDQEVKFPQQEKQKVTTDLNKKNNNNENKFDNNNNIFSEVDLIEYLKFSNENASNNNNSQFFDKRKQTNFELKTMVKEININEQVENIEILYPEYFLIILNYIFDTINPTLTKISETNKFERRKIFSKELFSSNVSEKPSIDSFPNNKDFTNNNGYIELIHNYLKKKEEFFLCILYEVMVKLNIPKKVFDDTFMYYMNSDYESNNIVSNIRIKYHQICNSGKNM